MFPGCPVLVQHGRVVRTNVRGTLGLSGSEGTCAQLEDYKVGASQQAELRRGQVAGSRVLTRTYLPTRGQSPGSAPAERTASTCLSKQGGLQGTSNSSQILNTPSLVLCAGSPSSLWGATRCTMKGRLAWP